MNNLQRGIYQPLADKVPIYDLADEDPEEERSRAPLLVVIALVVLAAFAGVVWLAYNQGVERGRQGASLEITAPEGPVRVAPPEAAACTPIRPERLQRPGSARAGGQGLRAGARRHRRPRPPNRPRSGSARPRRRPRRQRRPRAARARRAAPLPHPPQRVRPLHRRPLRRRPRPLRPLGRHSRLLRRQRQLPAPAGGGRAVSGAAVLQLGAFESQELANGAWATLRARYDSPGPARARHPEGRSRRQGHRLPASGRPLCGSDGCRGCLHAVEGGGRRTVLSPRLEPARRIHEVAMPASAAVYGCQGTELASDERAFFRDVRPFGFILFARNVDTPAQVASLCRPVARLDRQCERADLHRSGRRTGSAPQAAALAEPPAGAALRRAVRPRIPIRGARPPICARVSSRMSSGASA